MSSNRDRWTEDQLIAHMAKRNADTQSEHEPDDGPESKLQARCEKFLDENGYYYFHDRSRGVNKPGFLDLVIGMPEGRTVWVELKSRIGPMTEDQIKTYLKLKAMRHEVHIKVKSFAKFVEIIHGCKP